MNPIIESGKQYKGNQYPFLIETKTKRLTKTNPPPVGVGILCELLWSGISRDILLKIGIKIPNNK